MARDDSTAHGRAGQVFFDKVNQERPDYVIKSDVLDKLIRQQRKQLQILLKLRRETYNPSSEICNEFGLHKKFVAYGLVLQEKGNITITELARRLDVKRSTIYNYWPEVVRALKAM